MPFSIEIKARTRRHHQIRNQLRAIGADERGTDHQTDSYFYCENGRLKLREGNIENNLIFYDRPDEQGPSPSRVHLYHPKPDPALKEVLSKALGCWKVVKKSREICYVGNIKFHLDEVEGLGSFLEIEAFDQEGLIPRHKLEEQVRHYMKIFHVKEEDLIEQSYSDMVDGLESNPSA